ARHLCTRQAGDLPLVEQALRGGHQRLRRSVRSVALPRRLALGRRALVLAHLRDATPDLAQGQSVPGGFLEEASLRLVIVEARERLGLRELESPLPYGGQQLLRELEDRQAVADERTHREPPETPEHRTRD